MDRVRGFHVSVIVVFMVFSSFCLIKQEWTYKMPLWHVESSRGFKNHIHMYIYTYIFFFIFIGSNFKGGPLDLDKQDDALYLFIFFFATTD